MEVSIGRRYAYGIFRLQRLFQPVVSTTADWYEHSDAVTVKLNMSYSNFYDNDSNRRGFTKA